MTKKVVRLTWIPESEGGRRAPPTGSRYSTVARFGNQEWSLILELIVRNTYEAWFLSEMAPENLLVSGAKFELREGARIVARGEVE